MWGDFTNSSRLILKLQQLRICGAGLKTNKNTHGYSREDPHRHTEQKSILSLTPMNIKSPNPAHFTS